MHARQHQVGVEVHFHLMMHLHKLCWRHDVLLCIECHADGIACDSMSNRETEHQALRICTFEQQSHAVLCCHELAVTWSLRLIVHMPVLILDLCLCFGRAAAALELLQQNMLQRLPVYQCV